MKIGLCSVRGCREKHYAKTFCQYHYHCSAEYREKDRKRRSGKEGKQKERRKNRRYNHSFKGMMKRKLKGKNLSKKEALRAEKEFKNFNGKCQCCGSKKTSSKGWVLDHKGRKFRGILCGWCNVAAGFLKDSIRRAKKMARYLRRTSGFNHKS